MWWVNWALTFFFKRYIYLALRDSFDKENFGKYMIRYGIFRLNRYILIKFVSRKPLMSAGRDSCQELSLIVNWLLVSPCWWTRKFENVLQRIRDMLVGFIHFVTCELYVWTIGATILGYTLASSWEFCFGKRFVIFSRKRTSEHKRFEVVSVFWSRYQIDAVECRYITCTTSNCLVSSPVYSLYSSISG